MNAEKASLRNKIEIEREKLNHMISCGGKVEDIYTQNLYLDELIAQYMDFE